MKAPPPISESPGTMAFYVLSGLGLLFLGIFSEVGVRPKPATPITFVPGFLLLCIGAAIGMAALDRYYPKWGTLIYVVPALPIVLAQSSNSTSALPVLVYAGLYQLLRALLRVTLPAEE
jgi:hypothetical membrane protein